MCIDPDEPFTLVATTKADNVDLWITWGGSYYLHDADEDEYADLTIDQAIEWALIHPADVHVTALYPG